MLPGGRSLPSMPRWELNDGQAQTEPHDEDHVIRMIQAGLPEATLVRAEGTENWKGLRSHVPFAMALERRASGGGSPPSGGYGAPAAAPYPPAPPPGYGPGYGPPPGYPTAAPAGEHTYFQAEGVLVTSARAILGGITYAMANITSVRIHHEERPFSWIVGGIVCLIAAVVFLPIDCKVISFMFGLMGAGLFVGYFLKPDQYWVRIGTAGAETNAVAYPQAAQAQVVAGALNEAIVRRG